MTRPIRVAVVGGGCAAMACAFELTQPALSGRYEVTVFQEGWRLGGKGASGRGRHARIEEHGLHVWLGSYENAFAMLRATYDELARDPARIPIATWRDAFFAAPHVGVARSARSEWQVLSRHFAPLLGEPGDAALAAAAGVRRPAEHPLETILDFALRALAAWVDAFAARFRVPLWPPAAAPHDPMMRLRTPVGVGAPPALVAAHAHDVLAVLRATSGPAPRLREHGRALAVTSIAAIHRAFHALCPRGADDSYFIDLLDLCLATARGLLADEVDVSPRGFDVLADVDLIDWLARHGAREGALALPSLRGLYSLGFAFQGGDTERPRAAAGDALRLIVRTFFGYRGALFYKMRAGMGDIVFAPLYEVLARRGVRFKFFHRLLDVSLGPGPGHYVDALDFAVQAEPRGTAYDPLISVEGLPCWPAEPRWDQLRDGDRLRQEARRFESPSDTRATRRLRWRVATDFDFAVLGVPVGVIPSVAPQILARDARWREMVGRVETVATQALQLWMRPDLNALGWDRGPITMTAFAQPFDTWADMSHLVEEERWPDDRRPGSIAYFCNVLRDDPSVVGGEVEQDAHRRVLQNADAYIRGPLRALWPQLTDESVLDLYARANVSPSDRYTLNVPGSAAFRISPLDPTYDNLTVCGDWTACGLNFGCVESAVVSGRLAAHALSTSPPLEAIIGYDGP